MIYQDHLQISKQGWLESWWNYWSVFSQTILVAVLNILLCSWTFFDIISKILWDFLNSILEGWVSVKFHFSWQIQLIWHGMDEAYELYEKKLECRKSSQYLPDCLQAKPVLFSFIKTTLCKFPLEFQSHINLSRVRFYKFCFVLKKLNKF